MKQLNTTGRLRLALAGVLALGAAAQMAGAKPAPRQPAAKATNQIVYVCPMHKDVVALKPGKCPKCKMTLQKKTVPAVYTCPMHPEVLSLKPGKCPKCKMTLVKRK